MADKGHRKTMLALNNDDQVVMTGAVHQAGKPAAFPPLRRLCAEGIRRPPDEVGVVPVWLPATLPP